jgi:hypothetical protein
MGAVLEHLPIASGEILDKVNNGTWPTYSASLTRRWRPCLTAPCIGIAELP